MGNAKFGCLYFLEENGDFLGANPSPHPIKPSRYSPMYPKTPMHVTMGAGEALGAASPGTGDTVPRMRMVCGRRLPLDPPSQERGKAGREGALGCPGRG